MAINTRRSALTSTCSTTADMNISADCCRPKDSVDSTGRWALERASAVIRAFQGTCMILKSYLIMCKRDCNMCGYKLSWHLAVKTVTYNQFLG